VINFQHIYPPAKACGVVVRASASQLGDSGSNLCSAKSLSMIGWVGAHTNTSSVHQCQIRGGRLRSG